jgi:isocitrate dehydrogenase (NAD+)
MSDGMFLSACRQVSKDFPGIAYDEDLLDRVCLQVNKHEADIATSTAEDIY